MSLELSFHTGRDHPDSYSATKAGVGRRSDQGQVTMMLERDRSDIAVAVVSVDS